MILKAMSGLPNERLEQALDELESSELVFCRGQPPQAIYTFKHALLRDAAYSGLLKTRRAQLHGAIANALEEAQAFREQIMRQVDCAPPQLIDLSPVIGAHVGPGTIGVAVYND